MFKPSSFDLSDSDLLDLWERGSALHPLDRGLLVLSAELPEAQTASLADWPLGRRNKALVDLHCSRFGPRLQAWTACIACGEKMEFEINGPTLTQQNADVEPQSRRETVVVNGQSFRLPTSRDLAQVARDGDPRAAPIRLLDLCRVGEPVACSEEDVEEIGGQMALADPLAEIRIALRCPACGNESAETLDIVSFVWAEIVSRAKRLLWEVHNLASAYGWTETDVLSLNAARRSLYLEMVQA